MLLSEITGILKFAVKYRENVFGSYRQYTSFKRDYGIDLESYCKRKAAEKEGQILCEEDIVSDKMVESTNITKERAIFKIRQAQELFGITLKEYYAGKYYEYTNYHLMNILCSPPESDILDKAGQVISMRTGMTKEAALQRLKYISEKFDVEIKIVMFQQFYKCSDLMIRKKLDSVRGSWEGSLNECIKFIARRENVSFDEAKKRKEELMDNFGIDAFFNRRYFKMKDSEIFRIMDAHDEKLMNDIIRMAKEAGVSVGDFYYQRMLMMRAFGISKETYNGLRLASKSMTDINTFILDSDMRYLMTKYSINGDRRILDDKIKFARYFKQYLGRKVWSINDERGEVDTYSSFLDFLGELPDDCESIIAKPVNGLAGKGLKKFNIKKGNTEEVYKRIINMGNVLVEECVSQHEKLAGFGKGALNTMRILTIYENNKCNIIHAFLRVGTANDVVDNFSQGGYISNIDLQTGKTDGNGYTYDGRTYVNDPVTKKQIKGFMIPYWKEVCELVDKCSEMVKKVGLIGWDVAISKTGPCIIEGNSNPLVSAHEYAYQNSNRGHRYLLRDYIDEII